MCFKPSILEVHHTPSPLLPTVQYRQAKELQWSEQKKPLVLLFAPPGFGKTHLIKQWHHTVHQQGKKTAFLGLHPRGNHLPSLLNALSKLFQLPTPASSLDALHEMLQQRIQAQQLPDVIFIDQLENLEKRSALAAIESLLFLVQHGTRFVIAGRQIQQLRLAQWQLHQLVHTLSTTELKIQPQELPLSQQCLHGLNEWPAAVFCYYQQRLNNAATLSQTMALIEEYFEEIITDILPAEQQRLLMVSALMPHFNAQRLSKASGRPLAFIQKALDLWHRHNLFLEASLTSHQLTLMPLFCTFLKQRMQRLHPQLKQQIMQRIHHTSGHPTISLSFTKQEQVVLEQMVKGKSNKDIAKEMHLSEGTVKWHLHNLYKKMQVGSRAQAMLKATELLYSNSYHLAQ